MSGRFYPDDVEAFAFEPDRKRFSIISDMVKGNGVITLVPFAANDIVFRFAGVILPYQTQHSLQIKRGAYIHDPYFMGMVLHSCDPNMACDIGTFTFTALREILPGEYLTMDYETTEEELFREFSCCCGSEGCRGMIRGSRKTGRKHALSLDRERCR